MPVTAPTSGLPGVVPLSAATPGGPLPGRGAPAGAATDRVDVVSLSPAARQFQSLDAPVVAMRQLGVLLTEFDQLGDSRTPLVLGGLAAEIGSSAEGLGTVLQAMTPWQDGTTLPAAAGIALLRALEVVSPTEGSAGLSPAPAAPAADATRPAAAGTVPSGLIPDPADREPGAPDRAVPAGSAAGLDAVRSRSPSLDLQRQAEQIAGSMLHRAADTLGRMEMRLHSWPSLDDRGAANPETAWCATQIGLALAQVARAAHPADAAPKRGAAGFAALLVPWEAGPGQVSGRLRAGTAIVLLGFAAGTLALAGRMDFTTARIGVGVALAVAGMAWAWRRLTPWREPRLRVELTR